MQLSEIIDASQTHDRHMKRQAKLAQRDVDMTSRRQQWLENVIFVVFLCVLSLVLSILGQAFLFTYVGHMLEREMLIWGGFNEKAPQNCRSLLQNIVSFTGLFCIRDL